MSCRLLWISVIFFATLWTSSFAANILVNTATGNGSHFSVLSIVGRGLVKHGHKVTALISESYKTEVAHERYSHLKFDIFPDSTTSVTKGWSDWVMKHLLASRSSLCGSLGSLSPRAIVGLLQMCSEMLDHALERKLQGVSYDLLVLDAHSGCSVLLAGILDTPYVLVVPSGIKPSLARRHGIPDTTAYYPEMSTGLSYKMGFMTRVSNTLTAISEDLSVFFTYDVYSFLYSFLYKIRMPISELISNAQLILVNSDFAVDFPFPLQPNVVTVGGLTTRDAQPLPKDWEELMASSGQHGVVVFTLGTYVGSAMTIEDMQKFALAFAGLRQLVIWQMKGKQPANLPLGSNTKIVSWMPQNDLLAHPNVKVLVFHGGNNGMYEAIYHGVPMVVMPLISDTLDVGARILERGLGQSVDYFSFTSEDLSNAIRRVIYNTSYKANTKRVSAIFRERPQLPLDRAVHWIEHVLKYGGNYLRSSSSDLYFWQLYLLDVYLFLFLVGWLIYRILKYIYIHSYHWKCLQATCLWTMWILRRLCKHLLQWKIILFSLSFRREKKRDKSAIGIAA